MSRLLTTILLFTFVLLPGPLLAQLDLDHPGYFPIEELGIFPEESLNLEINLTGAMIKFIALATDEEDPELSRLVEGLESIRVRGADLAGVDQDSVLSAMQSAATDLTQEGWTSMVRIRDGDEQVFIYLKEQEGEMVGLTVLSLEEDEGMLINLVGSIDPAGLGGLAVGLDLPQLEDAVRESQTDD